MAKRDDGPILAEILDRMLADVAPGQCSSRAA